MTRTIRKTPNYRPSNKYIRSKSYTFKEYKNSQLYRGWWREDLRIYSYLNNNFIVVEDYSDETLYKYYIEYINYHKKETRDGNGLWSSSCKKVYAKRSKKKIRQQNKNVIRNIITTPELYDDKIFINNAWETNSYYGDDWVFW